MSTTATERLDGAVLTPELAAAGWVLLPGGVTRSIGVSPWWRHNPECAAWVVRESGRPDVEVYDVRVCGPSRGHASAGTARLVTSSPLLVLPTRDGRA